MKRQTPAKKRYGQGIFGRNRFLEKSRNARRGREVPRIQNAEVSQPKPTGKPAPEKSMLQKLVDFIPGLFP